MASPGSRASDRSNRTDDGGEWIVTGIVLGIIVYAGLVLMVVAGFDAVVPLVVVPPVLGGLIAATNLLGGGRRPGRPAVRPDAGATPGARTEEAHPPT